SKSCPPGKSRTTRAITRITWYRAALKSEMSMALDETAALDDWLAYLEGLHAKAIDLGLDRVCQVADRMALSLPCVRIVVGGTNGKGSTCAMLESILLAAGYKVGMYTSPHLLSFNERARVNGVNAS